MRLVGREADNILGGANSVNGDYSLVAFLRAIIIERTEWTLDSIVKGSTVLMHRIGNERDIRTAFGADGYAVIICETRNGYFPSELTHDGWESLDKPPYPISRYLSQFAKTRVFVNVDKQRVVVAVDRQATAKWIQGFISTFARVFRWYFTSELSAEEQAFFKAISVNNKDVNEAEAENILVDYINRAAEKLDFRDMSLHKHLDGFEKSIRESQLSQYRSAIENSFSSIRRYQREMDNLYRQLSDNQRLLKSLEEAPEEATTELFDFFSSHKCLDVVYTDGDRIKFGITETLEFYDEDEFKSVYRRKSSYMHTTASSDEIPRVMNAIFAEHKGVFVTNAVFTLSSMRYISMHQEMSREDVLPHPHIYFFQCSGGNDQYYSKYADSGEWQLAVEQAIGATKNLNFGDSTVVGKMIRWLDSHRNTRCIKLADSDKIVSVNEFLKILNEGEQQNG